MKDKDIHKLFEELQHDFDVETPNNGHENRFLNKLKTQQHTQERRATRPHNRLWRPVLGVAATIVLLITLTINYNTTPNPQGLASVSPEMAATQNFFSSVIAEELENIDSKRTPETEVLIKDAMLQMETLEKQYSQLKLDLKESGNDKRVIHAMIDNYWNRINILKSVLENIEGIKTFKLNSDETITTL